MKEIFGLLIFLKRREVFRVVIFFDLFGEFFSFGIVRFDKVDSFRVF